MEDAAAVGLMDGKRQTIEKGNLRELKILQSLSLSHLSPGAAVWLNRDNSNKHIRISLISELRTQHYNVILDVSKSLEGC